MSQSDLTMGVIGTSSKENEFRLPIHPQHLPQIERSLQKRIFLEEGYGAKFGTDQAYLKKHSGSIMSRKALFENCDIILIPKPTEDDFPFFKEGQILWGWPHCIQGEAITQLGIDKKMTMIAWEAMFLWESDEVAGLHTFYKNNELAGYCSVLHCLQLAGITGHYGPIKQAAVISFGSTARGAIYALRGMGYTDITVFTQRPRHAIHNQIPSLRYRQFKRAAPDSDDAVTFAPRSNKTISMAEELAKYDIIVNCIMQNTDRPIMYIKGNDINKLKTGTLIIDVSCDYQMGFEFAKPTSFEEPTFKVAQGITYYAVDHTPTYLWNSSTYEISQALLPYVHIIMGGEQAWDKNDTVRKAIEIKNGVILNPKILRFQNRANKYPHPTLT